MNFKLSKYTLLLNSIILGNLILSSPKFTSFCTKSEQGAKLTGGDDHVKESHPAGLYPAKMVCLMSMS